MQVSNKDALSDKRLCRVHSSYEFPPTCRLTAVPVSVSDIYAGTDCGHKFFFFTLQSSDILIFNNDIFPLSQTQTYETNLETKSCDKAFPFDSKLGPTV